MAASNIMMNSLCASRSALFPQSNLTDKSIFGGQKLRAAKRVVPPKCSGFIGQPTYPAKQANTRRGPASSQRILTVSGPAQTPAVPLLQRPSWSDVEFENDVTIYWDPAKVTAGAMTRIDYAPAEGSYDKRRDLLLVAGINGMGPSFAQIGHSVERGNTDRTIFEFTLRQVPADCATLDFFITDGHTVDDNGACVPLYIPGPLLSDVWPALLDDNGVCVPLYLPGPLQSDVWPALVDGNGACGRRQPKSDRSTAP
eukprot:jgi/Mesvir1/17020/Mv25870-RA.3